MSARQKKFERLKKKRIWPSIVLFVGFVIFCLSAILLFIQFFTTYILGTKVNQMNDEAMRLSRTLEDMLKDSENVTEALENIDLYMPGNNDIYITDRDGNELAKTGTTQPDFSTVIRISLSEDVVIISDSELPLIQKEGADSLFGVSMREVFSETFRRDKDDRRGFGRPWLQETIINQKIWLQAPVRDDHYRIYISSYLKIERQDAFYVCIFAAIILLLLLIPLVILFVNTIRAIIVQQRITRLMYLDIVTGGRNWLYFQHYATRTLTRYRNAKKAYALVDLHLERYHNYCACHGVKAGEELLGSMDAFLKARIGKEEIFARNEGADFGLLLHCEGQNAQEYEKYCRKRVRSLLAELTGLKPEQKIRFHAGIYMIDPYIAEDGRRFGRRKAPDINQMYNYANTAGVSIRNQVDQQIAFFNEQMLDQQKWDRKIEENMEAALHGEEFQVYLQPKYSPTDRRLVGAEALVRWISPTDGVIMPGQFIPIFEENGFITQLDDYMISRVAKLQAEWTLQGRKTVPVSVNVSRAHFAQEGLAEHICRLVDDYGPKHELIELEVTESAFFDDKDILIETVKQLKAYGFRVSMDDFGAGYSSLNSLKDIPLDVLKLDAEFFRGEEASGRGDIIVEETIRLARGLDMHVVAEGIEKKEQVDFLAGLGCDMIQGYYFAKPMPVAEFEEKVERDA